MMINKEMVFIGGFVIALFLLKKKEEADEFVEAAGRRTRRREPVKSDFRSASQVRRLQKMFPYDEGDNAKKPWWKCGCGNEGVGGCVKGVCIGPGSISIRF